MSRIPRLGEMLKNLCKANFLKGCFSFLFSMLSFGIFSLSVQSISNILMSKYVLWISPFLAFTFLFKLNFWPLNFEAFCQPHLTHTRLPLLTWMSTSQTCVSTILALKSPRTSANQRWWNKANLLSEPSGFPGPHLLFFGRLNDLYLVLTGFPGGSAPLRWLSRQSLPAMRGPGFNPGLGNPWEKKWKPHSSILPGSSMDRGDWWPIVHGVTYSQTHMSD